MLTETYKKIHMKSDLEWKFGRAQLIRSLVKQSAAPAPMNLIIRPILYIYSVKRHGRWMCTKYARYFVAEDEHEGAEKAGALEKNQLLSKIKTSLRKFRLKKSVEDSADGGADTRRSSVVSSSASELTSFEIIPISILFFRLCRCGSRRIKTDGPSFGLVRCCSSL